MSGTHAERVSVLVVANDPAFTAFVTAALSRETGFAATVTTSLDAALRRLREQPGDEIVLVDLQLPDCSGTECVTRLQPDERPVVVLASSGDRDQILASLRAGAQDYLVKEHASLDQIGRALEHAIERHRMVTDLARANRLREYLLSVASHEIRSPLAAITGLADILLDRDDELESADRARMLRSILNSSRRIERLTAELLTAARSAGRPIRAQVEPTDVRAVVEDLRAELDGHYGEVVDRIEGEVVALAAADHLTQVLTNLIENASKYGRPPIEIDADASDGHVHISVTDHGDGVPPGFVDRLFDMHARAENHRQNPAPGTGLGLSAARTLAEAMRGSLHYDETYTDGARFVVSLAAVAETPQGLDAGELTG